jgi:hypothetical protein
MSNQENLKKEDVMLKVLSGFVILAAAFFLSGIAGADMSYSIKQKEKSKQQKQATEMNQQKKKVDNNVQQPSGSSQQSQDSSMHSVEDWAKKQQQKKERQKDLDRLRNLPPSKNDSDLHRNRPHTPADKNKINIGGQG